MDALPLVVNLASLLLGVEHALVCQATCNFAGQCTEGELMRETKLQLDRLRFILWDLHYCALGNFDAPVFKLTSKAQLQQAVDGIACAEQHRRFHSALKRAAAGVTAQRGAPHPLKKKGNKRKFSLGGSKKN